MSPSTSRGAGGADRAASQTTSEPPANSTSTSMTSGGSRTSTSTGTSTSTSTSMQQHRPTTQQIMDADSSPTAPSPVLEGHHPKHSPSPSAPSAPFTPSAYSSVAPSPDPSSREPSPIRLNGRTSSLRSLASATANTTRSRIASTNHHQQKQQQQQQHDGNGHSRNNSNSSPTRSAKTVLPSHGSSRSLASSSSAATPVIPTPQDPETPMPTPRKSAFSSAGAESPRWPGSPRLQPPASPRVGPYTPPSSSSAAAPAINVQRATPSPRSTNTRTANANSNANANPNPTSRTDHNSNSNTSTNTSTSSKDTNSGNYSHSNSSNSNVSANTYASASAESDVDESQMPSGSRTPARGSPSTLETVREVSLSSSPSTDHGVSLDGFRDRLSSEDSTATVRGSSHLHHPTDIPMLRTRQALLAQSQANESGNESGGAGPSGSTPAERKRTMSTISTGPSPPLLSRQSSALSTKQLKGKEELSKHMTVETETVEVLQQNALLSSTGGAGAHKTLKNKQSSETIRPKREKRKATRKLPAVNPLSASSKADNFEAKIASAVDEANTSDSEETFVYDSNPPERDDRQRRFHSRTPSATSMVSQGGERVNLRSIYGMIDERPGMASAAKRGNKFLNTLSNNGADSYHDDENGKGSGRSTAGSARGSARHHHLGRWGRNHANNGHTSLFDSDSPFLTTASRSKLGSSSSQGARRSPAGPPSPHHHRVMHNGKRSLMQFPPSTYDLDEAAPADDERTPLIHGSVRSSRSSRSRRPNSRSHPSMRHIESQSFRQRQSCLNRFAACLVVTIMLFLGITGAIGFMFATSQPMTDIELRAIKNVLASEPELMFDLTLKAHNPNIVVVTIDQADLEIFAKSIHAGTDGEWSQFPEVPAPPDPAPGFGALDDPPYDTPDDDSAPNMKLGTINEFDSPLSFEGSFFHHGWSESTGEVRLHAPGNFTNGGSTRWGRILENEFDLIVKGVVRYTLPFSNHIKSASISGRTTVKPNSANDPSLRPNTTIPDA